MASIKVKFRPSKITDREGSIYYQIIHERCVRHIASRYRVLPSEWCDRRATVIAGATTPEREQHLRSIREGIHCDVERLTVIIRKFDRSGRIYSIEDVAEEFKRFREEYSLFNFMERVIDKLRANGKIRTSETYTAALRSFRHFRQGRDIMLDRLSTAIMEEYEAWHTRRGIQPNTISFYNRILRAVYNRAVEEEVIENRYPFRHVYTGVDKTVKRALPLSIIRKINNLDLSGVPAMAYARDMFMLSFMLRGMSFIDMAFLRKSDLRGGRLTYRRRKTGQTLVVAWTPEMQCIVDRYPQNAMEYLLPIIRKPAENLHTVYRNIGYNINHNLRKIAYAIGLSVPFTLYVARHSWASVARAKGIPLSVISEGMGHDSEATTQIYLASLDASAIDRANSLILRSL
ncbi:MAG: site-specific integrase [Paramuribaculum sp.]|nr:site-specific integrase [Paramuribaculum sp.]